MNKFIEYFYNIEAINISKNAKYYSFTNNNYLYKLYILEESHNFEQIYKLNQKLIKNTLTSEIILNKDHNIITIYKNVNYILIKLYINPQKVLSLDEIYSLDNCIQIDSLNSNWGTMWSNKIDYLEKLINENGKKYPLIVDSFNYFVGLTENAISYYNNITKNDTIKYSLSHKVFRIEDTIENIYNPLNIIYDYRIRDLAEYLKISFFKNNYNIENELNNYLYHTNLSNVEVELLISRLLYPSFYFEMYEDIIIDNQEEKIIETIIEKLPKYEEYLNNIINYFKQKYYISTIEWLKKRRP